MKVDHARRNHDIDVDLLSDALDARKAAAVAGARLIDQGVNVGRLQRAELSYGVGRPLLFTPPGIEVLHDLSAQDEDMLVHEHTAQIGCIDGTLDRVHE